MLSIFYPDEVQQGTKAWLKLREGLLTGTDAFDVLSGQSLEQILGKKKNNSFGGNYYTRRGHILENEAREIYSEVYNEVVEIGFVKNDKYPLCGYSPDGFIKTKDGLALWECKAFNEIRHLKVYKELDAHILAQVQFGLMMTEFPWCDLVLYNPDMKDVNEAFLVRRIEPIPDIQNNLKAQLNIYMTNSLDF